jgi:dienelactone hydrolase
MNRREFSAYVLSCLGATSAAMAGDTVRVDLLGTIRAPEQWEPRRKAILAAMQEAMGPLPSPKQRPPLDLEVVQTVDAGDVVRKLVRYTPEPGDRVPAYLLIPKRRTGPRPAALCLHQTIAVGKAEPVGLGDNPELAYGLELARHGYVALAPDYPNFGTYRFDAYAAGYASATMKGIWNHIRAVDVLQSLSEVDDRRIACIGHSLGGHNSLFVAAFEPRIGAVASSCGFNSFAKYYGGDLTGWSHAGYMPRIASRYGKDPKRMPFDFPEVLAAIAPRPVFVCAPRRDANFEISGVEDCLRAAAPVYRLLGAAGKLEAVHPDCEHSFPAAERQRAYRFFDQALGVGTS